MKQFLLSFTVLMCMAASCNSTKQATTNTDAKAESEAMIANGFSLANIVVQPSEEGCPVVIKTESEYLDPINLKPEFNKDQLQVWVKFARLRRMNRCTMAAPVNIMEIKKAN